MKFTNSELEMIYQYAAATKAETINDMREIVPDIRDTLTRVIVENTINKLNKIPEPECSRFIVETKACFLEVRDSSIRQRLATAKEQTKTPIMQGHDLMGAERFMENTRHMIILDVLNSDSPVGYKGERYRAFLSDEQYQNARKSQERGEIMIKSHATIKSGEIYPDKIHKLEKGIR